MAIHSNLLLLFLLSGHLFFFGAIHSPFGAVHCPLGLFNTHWGYSFTFGAINSHLRLFISLWGYSFPFGAIHSSLGLLLHLWAINSPLRLFIPLCSYSFPFYSSLCHGLLKLLSGAQENKCISCLFGLTVLCVTMHKCHMYLLRSLTFVVL